MSSVIKIPLEKVIDIKIEENDIIFEIKGSHVTFKKKKCEWCGKPFTPQSSNNKYCSENCKKYARLEKVSHNMAEYRKRYDGVQLSSDLKNLGTGGLGGHRVDDFEEEYKKIRKELKDRRLR
jgi:hypothetical protein